MLALLYSNKGEDARSTQIQGQPGRDRKAVVPINCSRSCSAACRGSDSDSEISASYQRFAVTGRIW